MLTVCACSQDTDNLPAFVGAAGIAAAPPAAVGGGGATTAGVAVAPAGSGAPAGTAGGAGSAAVSGSGGAPSSAAGGVLAGSGGRSTSGGAGGGAGMPSGGQGGAGGEAGMPASAQGGGGGAGGVSSSAGSADFWDTFEQDSQLDMARYELAMTNCSGTGMVSLDASSGHSGSHSLRVDGAGNYCNHVFVRPKAFASALSVPVYVRVFVKVAMPLGAGHTTFAAMHDMHEDKDLRLGGQNQVLIWNRESDDATLPELSPTGTGLSKPLTAGTWQCLEWMIDSAKREMRSWLDGTPIEGLTLDADATADVDRQWQRKTDWQPMLVDLRLGWESYGDQAETLWFDDLAVGKTRIGCDPDPSPRSP